MDDARQMRADDDNLTIAYIDVINCTETTHIFGRLSSFLQFNSFFHFTEIFYNINTNFTNDKAIQMKLSTYNFPA